MRHPHFVPIPTDLLARFYPTAQLSRKTTCNSTTSLTTPQPRPTWAFARPSRGSKASDAPWRGSMPRAVSSTVMKTPSRIRAIEALARYDPKIDCRSCRGGLACGTSNTARLAHTRT